MEIIYAALLLNKCGKEINQKNLTNILKAAEVPYEIETVIKVVDGLQGVDIKEVLSRGFIAPVKVEEVLPEDPAGFSRFRVRLPCRREDRIPPFPLPVLEEKDGERRQRSPGTGRGKRLLHPGREFQGPALRQHPASGTEKKRLPGRFHTHIREGCLYLQDQGRALPHSGTGGKNQGRDPPEMQDRCFCREGLTKTIDFRF